MDNSKKLYIVQITAFFVSSVSICFMPLGSYYDGKSERVLAIIFGIIFWLFLIIGIGLNVLIYKSNKEKQISGRCGIIRLFQNKYAKITDVILMISFIASVIIIVCKSTIYFGAIVLFAFAFSFEMHCILNSKYFNKLFFNKNNK